MTHNNLKWKSVMSIAVFSEYTGNQILMRSRLLNFFFPDAIRVSRCNPSTNNGGLVLLLGWSGSKQKHFNKLIKEYDSLGMSTVSFIMPPALPLVARDWLENRVSKLLVEEFKDESNKLVVHSYSNNGMWVFASLMQQNLIQTPKAFISDAAPMFWYVQPPLLEGSANLARVFTAILLNKDVYHHPIISPVLTSTFFVLGAFNKFLLRVQGNSRIGMDVEKLNKYARDSLPYPSSLFIYSRGDKLVAPEDVKDFIGYLRQRNISIEEVEYGDKIAHTGSFYSDTQGYMKAVKRHLSNNLVI